MVLLRHFSKEGKLEVSKMTRLMVVRAVFIAAAALFSFLIVVTLAKIVQPSSWAMVTLLVVGFLLIALGSALRMREEQTATVTF